MFFLPVPVMMEVCVCMYVCVRHLFWPAHELSCPSLALPSGLQTHRSRTQNCDGGPEVVCVSVKGSKGKHQHGCVGEGQLIFRERPLALASRWPLTQIKLPQFAPSPPSLSFSLLPTARHFCFHMADFSGNTLIFVAFGVGSRVCCACQVFSLRLSPAPKLNCSVISCHPPSTTSLSHTCK